MKQVCSICCGVVVDNGSRKQFCKTRIRAGAALFTIADCKIDAVLWVWWLQTLRYGEFRDCIQLSDEELTEWRRFRSDLLFLESSMKAFVSVTEILNSKNCLCTWWRVWRTQASSQLRWFHDNIFLINKSLVESLKLVVEGRDWSKRSSPFRRRQFRGACNS